jgi:predicted RNA-binding Zn-ribbon protein involved in translation (DUF1610 family)
MCELFGSLGICFLIACIIVAIMNNRKLEAQRKCDICDNILTECKHSITNEKIYKCYKCGMDYDHEMLSPDREI